jgi:hypothetical protein
MPHHATTDRLIRLLLRLCSSKALNLQTVVAVAEATATPAASLGIGLESALRTRAVVVEPVEAVADAVEDAASAEAAVVVEVGNEVVVVAMLPGTTMRDQVADGESWVLIPVSPKLERLAARPFIGAKNVAVGPLRTTPHDTLDR